MGQVIIGSMERYVWGLVGIWRVRALFTTISKLIKRQVWVLLTLQAQLSLLQLVY